MPRRRRSLSPTSQISNKDVAYYPEEEAAFLAALSSPPRAARLDAVSRGRSGAFLGRKHPLGLRLVCGILCRHGGRRVSLEIKHNLPPGTYNVQCWGGGGVESQQAIIAELQAMNLSPGEPMRDRPRDMPYLPPLNDGEPLDYQLGVGIAGTSPAGEAFARAMRLPG